MVLYCQSERFAKLLKENGRLERFIFVPSGEHGPVTFNDSTFSAMVQSLQQEANNKTDRP